jgi:hypothetical protein
MQQNLPKTAQNCQRSCPKTISSRNFEIPPKFEILVFLTKKKKNLHVEGAPEHVHTVWIFNARIFYMPFSMSKNGLCM